MKVVNSSILPRGIHFESNYTILEPGEVIEINPFDLTDLQEISKYVRQGVFTLIDDEDDDLEDEYLQYKFTKKVDKEGSVFKNINFDNDIDDF